MNQLDDSISVVVVARNAEATLDLCLSSLMKLNYPKKLFEIIIVDNASTDRSAEIIKRYPVQYIFEAQEGISYARNTGIKASKNALIAFCDADCVVDSHWLKESIPYFQNKNIKGVGGKVLTYKPDGFIEKFIEWSGSYNRQMPQLTKASYILPWLSTSNAIFRKEVIRDLGGFDTNFKRYEDLDLTIRLLLRGFQVDYAPKAIVYHKHRNKFLSFWKWIYQKGRHYLAVLHHYQFILKKKKIEMLVEEIGRYILLNLINAKDILKDFFLDLNFKIILYRLFNLVRFTAYLGGFCIGWFHLIGKKTQTNNNLDRQFIVWNDGSKLAVLDFSKRNYLRYDFDDFGKNLWNQLIVQMKPVDDIAAQIVKETGEAPERIQKDLNEFLQRIENKEIFASQESVR